MNKIKSSHSISGLFVFLLLGVFVVFSMTMVLLGTKAYRSTILHSEMHNRQRISTSYIRSMLRADDESDVLMVEDLDGIQSVSMVDTYDDTSYITRLYVYDGMLREWFAEADMEFDPRSGEAVCEAESLRATLEDGLLTVTVTADGTDHKIIYAPRAVMQEEQE